MHDRLKSLLPLAFATMIMLLAVIFGFWLQPDHGNGESPETAPSLFNETAAPPSSSGPGETTWKSLSIPTDEPPIRDAGAELPFILQPLSILAEPPDWQSLEIYQETITRQAFEDLVTRVFTTSDSWRDHIEIDEHHARVRTHASESENGFVLRFAKRDDVSAPVTRFWRGGEELAPAPVDTPLKDLHIAIDPGHIGGDWAKMEERWFSLDGEPPVTEGDMTLKVAKMLKPILEKLGARVTLVRDTAAPITPMRPEMLLETASDQAGDVSPAAMQRMAERLFYRTAEIRARANVVNHKIRPDLVICLHFNAEAWGDPANPTLVDRTHFHILLNGGYTDDELAMSDQRFAMLQKLLQRTHEEEALVGASVADFFSEASGLPPYTYCSSSRNVRQVNGHPFLWARNLLANRLYDCPVLFMEPYVMNSRQDYARIQAGDYPGLREIDGKLLPSIYREYVEGLADSLAQHYRMTRGIAIP